MATVYVEARPKGHPAGARIDDYVVEDAAALVVRKELRIDQAVTKVAEELGIEPVHHLVDLGTLF